MNFSKRENHLKENVEVCEAIQFFNKLDKESEIGNVFNVLLLGETGTGKSTLINYFVNFFLQGHLLNPEIVIPNAYYANPTIRNPYARNEKDMFNRQKSKTDKCIVYSFEYEGNSFRFIDTPGMSSTEGVEHDDKNIEDILAVAEACEKLSAICIVFNGTIIRSTANIINTLKRLQGSIPNALLKNLIILLTNCSSRMGVNLNPKECLDGWDVKKNNIFYMQNSAFSKPPAEWQGDANLVEEAKHDWNKSMKEIEKMLKRLPELGIIATKIFQKMQKARNDIKSQMHEMLLEVKRLQKVHDSLESAKKAMPEIANNIYMYSNFQETNQIQYKEREDCNYHNTWCIKHDQVCQDDCYLEYTPNDCTKTFAYIYGVNGKGCKVCKCPPAEHYLSKTKMVIKTKSFVSILNDVKQLYDLHVGRKQELEQKINTLESDLTLLEQTLKTKEKQIIKLCNELKSICSSFNFVDELHGVIWNLKLSSQALTSSQARGMADDFIKSIEKVVDSLSRDDRMLQKPLDVSQNTADQRYHNIYAINQKLDVRMEADGLSPGAYLGKKV